MAFKPILAATIAFLLSLVVLGWFFAFFALALFGERQGDSSFQSDTALLVGGALLFVISVWFAFRVYRRVTAVIAGTFVKPVNEEAKLEYRLLFGCSILDFALFFAGLVRLDVTLLLRHETMQGWITGISVEPYKHSFKSFHRSTAHYAYIDKDGVQYQPEVMVLTIGYESQGDRFTVL